MATTVDSRLKSKPKSKFQYQRIFNTASLLLLLISLWFGYSQIPIEDVQELSQRKIIAVGDLHGDLENTLKTFRMAKIIDHNNHWIAGDSVFVQTGDIVDRGPDTIQLYELMQRLTIEAEMVGGQVIELLGNHEILNMQHVWNWVTKVLMFNEEDVDSFGGIEARIKAWSREGWIGKYLRTLGITTIVNGTVFFHGGANPKWASLKVDKMNRETKESLNHLNPTEMREVSLFGDDGPLWYRDFAQKPESEICNLLDISLKNLGANRMVVGHTPQMNGIVLSRCHGKFFVIDVGISRIYGGYSAALEILGDHVYALYPSKRILLAAPDK